MIEFTYNIDGEERNIALAMGDTLEIETGGPTDEGYFYESIVFMRDEDGITAEVTTRAQDCDGRLDQYSDYDITIDEDGRALFNCTSSSQRDYSAEAMGY